MRLIGIGRGLGCGTSRKGAQGRCLCKNSVQHFESCVPVAFSHSSWSFPLGRVQFPAVFLMVQPDIEFLCFCVHSELYSQPRSRTFRRQECLFSKIDAGTMAITPRRKFVKSLLIADPAEALMPQHFLELRTIICCGRMLRSVVATTYVDGWAS